MPLKSWLRMTDEEYDELNPPHCKPLMRVDGLYFKTLDDPKWLPVGHIPMPRTRWQWFAYHMIHGLAMRYRFLPVLFYSIREAFWDKLDIEASECGE